MQSRDTQLNAIQEMARQCQGIIARHDDLLFKIKALTATLWSAASGWALSSGEAKLLLVALFSALGLWFVAATFRAAQKRYVHRSGLVFQFLLDPQALDEFQEAGVLPSKLPRSLGGHERMMERFTLVARGFISPTVSVYYGFFTLMSVVLYAQLR